MPKSDTERQRVRDMELSVGAEPADELLGELDATEEDWARGAALYGPGGLFDDQRVAMLSVIALKVRDELAGSDGRVTDDLVKQKAHAHKDYIKFLQQHTRQRIEWLSLNARRDAIILRINRGQALIRLASRMV